VSGFGANRKRVYDFLLVRNSNLGPILHRFGDIAGICAPDPTPIPPQFWGCSRCTRWPTLGSAQADALSYSAVKLKRIPTYVITVPQRHGRTDRRTDRRTTYDRNTALCTEVHRAVKSNGYRHIVVGGLLWW